MLDSRIVHYVRATGGCRTALVTAEHDRQAGLAVFSPSGCIFVHGIPHDAAGRALSWHELATCPAADGEGRP